MLRWAFVFVFFLKAIATLIYLVILYRIAVKIQTIQLPLDNQR